MHTKRESNVSEGGSERRSTDGHSLHVRHAETGYAVLFMRIILLAALMLATGLLGFYAYQTSRSAEIIRFREQYEASVVQLQSSITKGFLEKERLAGATASAFPFVALSAAASAAPAWAQVYPTFEAFGQNAVPLAGARAVSIEPIIRPGADRQAYEAFVAANWLQLAGPGLAALPNSSQAALAFRFTKQGIYGKTFNATLNAMVNVRADAQPQADAEVEAFGMPPFWTPIHQISPLAGNWPVLTFDLHNETLRRSAIDSVVLTGQPACTDIIQLVQDTAPRASGLMIGPMWAPIPAARATEGVGGANACGANGTGASAGEFNASSGGTGLAALTWTGDMVLAGFSSVVFSWDQVLNQSLPSYVRGLDVVITGPSGNSFTLRVDSGVVLNIGFGDFHQPGQSGYQRYFTVRTAGASFTFTLYPTDTYYQSYLTGSPRTQTVGVVAMFVGISCIFGVFDCLSSGRFRKVRTVAGQASALVDDILPQQVIPRVLHAQQLSTAAAKEKEAIAQQVIDALHLLRAETSMPPAAAPPGPAMSAAVSAAVSAAALDPSSDVPQQRQQQAAAVLRIRSLASVAAADADPSRIPETSLTSLSDAAGRAAAGLPGVKPTAGPPEPDLSVLPEALAAAGPAGPGGARDAGQNLRATSVAGSIATAWGLRLKSTGASSHVSDEDWEDLQAAVGGPQSAPSASSVERERRSLTEAGAGKSLGRTVSNALSSIMRGGSAAAPFVDSMPIADRFDNCTVLFSDFVGFTSWSTTIPPEQVFSTLETYFSLFDALARRLGVYKIQTIGDAYMCVTGLPEPTPDHAVIMADFALGVLECCRRAAMRTGITLQSLRLAAGPGARTLPQIRVGFRSGSLVGGVIRGDRTLYTLFGDTVNMASRMESTSSSGRIQLSESAATLLQRAGQHEVVYRGLVNVKGKGPTGTFLLKRRLQQRPNLVARRQRSTVSVRSSTVGSVLASIPSMSDPAVDDDALKPAGSSGHSRFSAASLFASAAATAAANAAAAADSAAAAGSAADAGDVASASAAAAEENVEERRTGREASDVVLEVPPEVLATARTTK